MVSTSDLTERWFVKDFFGNWEVPHSHVADFPLSEYLGHQRVGNEVWHFYNYND